MGERRRSKIAPRRAAVAPFVLGGELPAGCDYLASRLSDTLAGLEASEGEMSHRHRG